MPLLVPIRSLPRDFLIALVDPLIGIFKFFGIALVIATAIGVILQWPALIATCGIFAMILFFWLFLLAHIVVSICVRLEGVLGDSYPLISLLAKTPQVAATIIRGTLLVLCIWSADIYVALLRADFAALAATMNSNILMSVASIAVTLIGVGDTGFCPLAKKALSIGGYVSFAVSSSLLAVALKDATLLIGAQALLDHPLWFRDRSLVPVVQAFFATKTGIWLHALVVVPVSPLIFVLPFRAAYGDEDGIRMEAGHLFTGLTLYFAWLLCSYLLAIYLL